MTIFVAVKKWNFETDCEIKTILLTWAKWLPVVLGAGT
jgi:hypothetical protein